MIACVTEAVASSSNLLRSLSGASLQVLMGFARKGAGCRVTVDLHDGVRRQAGFLRRTSGTMLCCGGGSSIDEDEVTGGGGRRSSKQARGRTFESGSRICTAGREQGITVSELDLLKSKSAVTSTLRGLLKDSMGQVTDAAPESRATRARAACHHCSLVTVELPRMPCTCPAHRSATF